MCVRRTVEGRWKVSCRSNGLDRLGKGWSRGVPVRVCSIKPRSFRESDECCCVVGVSAFPE
jgi:hypothetical protein